MAGARAKWAVNVAVYSIAGGAASAFVGAALGLIGQVLMPQQLWIPGIGVALVVAMIALARELGFLSFRLPQLTRQTKGIWAKQFPSPLAAALWGLDVGLVFTTWFTFAGIWLILILAIILADPAFGMALFLAYWLGRTLPVWLAPALARDAREIPQLLRAIDTEYRLFQLVHAAGVVSSAAALGVLGFKG